MKHFVTKVLSLLVFMGLLFSPAPGFTQESKFKVGDSVEVLYAGQWVQGFVTKEPQTIPFVGLYVVTVGTMTTTASDSQGNIRAHQNNSEERALADQSSKAFASWPRGNGVGAQFGGREPATCPNRKAAPNPSTAQHYLLCDMEGIDGFGNLNLMTNVTVQMGRPRPFNYKQDSGRSQIDVRAPVYDIRGSFREFQCSRPNRAAGAYAATHTCLMYPQPQAAGTCYRDTFSDWHCTMAGSRLASTNGIQQQMPPR